MLSEPDGNTQLKVRWTRICNGFGLKGENKQGLRMTP